MLVITNTFTTEDGKTFPSKNKALIHAALQASGVYLDDYKKREVVEALDSLLFVVDKHEHFVNIAEALDFPTPQNVEVKE